MDRYQDFTVEDFVWDSFFRQWVLTPTTETAELWEEWLENHPESLEKIQQAKSIVLSLRLHEPEITDPEITAIVQQTMGRIKESESEAVSAEMVTPSPRYRFPWLRVAAAMAILIISGWLVYSFTRQKDHGIGAETAFKNPKTESAFEEKWNKSSKPMQIVLSDGSQIMLAPNSRVHYLPKLLAERREVYLIGEAFFNITKNPESPFYVYSNGLVTKVLGTSFTIKAYDNSNEVTVEVKTGRVSVFPETDITRDQKVPDLESKSIVLLPNQKIIYSREEVRMVKTLVEKPEMVVAKAEIPQFEFEDTPASDVFDTIGRAYGIEIIYDAALLKDCPLTATLENQTLHEKLSIICSAVESSYEIMDGQIVIHSKGCRN